MTRLHGLRPAAAPYKGEVHFAVINLFKAVEHAQAFPGRNKYGTLVAWSRKESERFLAASGKLEDTFWKIDRVAGLLDEARRKIVIDFSRGTVTPEEAATFQAGYRDLPLYLDVLLIYLRILADCIADITSQFYKGKHVPPFSFRDQENWSKWEETDPEYAGILRAQTSWFSTLAGDTSGEGLRDLIVHKMVRTQLFYQPGQTPDHSRVHAFLYGPDGIKGGTLVPTIQKLVDELFLFLDSYVAHFMEQIERKWGGALRETRDPRFSVLYEFEDSTPSAWLYPCVTTSREGN
jgi:hypothetical protein